jgi:hypothetical protein
MEEFPILTKSLYEKSHKWSDTFDILRLHVFDSDIVI